GFNGEFYFSMVDIDPKNFDSLEAMNQAIEGWENRNPGISLCPRVKTQSSGYRYFIGFESVPKNWGNTISFTFTQGGEKSLGELMVGSGGLGIILGKGLKGNYSWDRNACGDVPVFQSPESVGLFEIEKVQKINSIYDNKSTSEEAREALSFIPVIQFDDDYQGWINIGMACHAAGLDFEDWDNWSRGSKEYSNSKDCFNHWKSFKDGGITPATLFKAARDNGYKPTKQKNSNYQQPQSKTSPKTSGTAALKPERKNNEDEVREALKAVKAILLDYNIDDISKEIKIDKIRENLSIDGKLWDKLRSKVNKEVRGDLLELELKSINLIDDPIKKTQAIHDLTEKYRMSINSIQSMLNELKARNTTQQFESMELGDLFDEVCDAIDYLVPGLLPKGESALLVASPKVGKSLLAVDLAFAVATGEDYFLGEKTKVGRVLYVSVDESKQSVKSKLIKRGFRKYDSSNIKVVTKFNIVQLEKLKAEIEDFRPCLVIIDSLKSITQGSEISENSAEFSDNLYKISGLCNDFNASCLLIHHSNKNSEITGVDSVRGSSAISGAMGNTWILNRVPKPDEHNKKKMVFDPTDTRRQLYCYSRDSDGKSFNLEFNPENNSWDVAGEAGVSDEEQEARKTNKERILSIMKMNLPHHPEGLKGKFIHDCLELEQPGAITKSSMYVELNRLVSAKIVGSKPIEDSRGSLYFLYGYGQNTTTQPSSDQDTTHSDNSENGKIPPPPPPSVPTCNQNSENIINKEFELGYKENNFGYKLVTSEICNQDDVTNGKAHYQGVSTDKTELVTNLVTQGGGGFPLENVTKNLDPKPCTTTQSNTTTLVEPEPLDINQFKEGDILFDNLGQPHKLIKPVRGMWQSHRKDCYISRNDIQQGKYHRATIEDITKLIQKTIKGKNKAQAQWLCNVYGGDADSLMAKAIDTNPEELALIFDFDDWA
ncbi:AAA family ATPase, partial [Planktothrix sp.]